MRSVVALSDVFTSHSTWLKPLALVYHSHPIHGHAQRSLSVFSPSLSTSCCSTTSSLSWWPTVTPWQSTPCATPQTGPSSPWTITSPSQGVSLAEWLTQRQTQLTQESTQTYLTDSSWFPDGWSYDEWNEDWSSVGCYEVWEHTIDNSASLLRRLARGRPLLSHFCVET